jgi:hypothetical protein
VPATVAAVLLATIVPFRGNRSRSAEVQHQVWDIKNQDVYKPDATRAGLHHLIQDMATNGFVLPYQHYTEPVLVHNCGDILYHGTARMSVNNIVAHGISKSAASRVGGGDVFWMTTDLKTARLFAKANPALSPDFGVVRIEIAQGIRAKERAGIISLDESGAYVVKNWKAFSKIARYFVQG